MVNSKKFQQFFLLTIFHIMFLAILLSSCGDDKKNNPIISEEDIIASPAVLAFQQVRIDDMKKMNLTVKNETSSKVSVNLTLEGNDKDYFKFTGEPKREILPEETIIVEVSFTPLESRGYAAKLFVKYEGKTVEGGEITLTGAGTTVAKMNVSPNPVNFGTTKPGVSRSMNVSIENIYDKTLDLSLEILNDADAVFQIVGASEFSIPVGKIQTVAVRFTPKAEKSYTAIIKIDKDNQIELKGEGSNKINLNFSPTELSFGEILVGQKSTKKVTVQNLTTYGVTLKPIITGADAANFKVTSFTKDPIETGLTGEVFVEFTPTLGKVYTAQLYLDEDKLAYVPLSGKGIIQDDIELGSASLNFGTIEINTNKELSLTIKNKFGQPLNLTNSISGSGLAAFQISQNVTSLSAGQTSEMKINFLPTEAKDYQAQINIVTSNDVQYIVTIQGRGKPVESLSLVSAKVTSAPTLDGNASDAVWNQAKALNLTLTQIQPTQPPGTMPATVRSVNDGTYIYFLVEVEDATQDDVPNKFEFKGGDAGDDANWTLNVNGQDGLALMFPISSVVEGDEKPNTFDLVGCQVACHTSQQTTKYESGMYPTKGSVDIWYWKAGTTNPQGKSDDYYAVGSDGPADVRSTRSGDVAGRTFSDPNFPVKGSGKMLPISVPGSDNNGFDKNKFIWDNDADAFDAKKPNPATGKAWAAGDIVPGWKLRAQNNPYSGRGDIEAKGKYSNGKWTIEIKRALNTKSENADDVVLKTDSKIPFSIAYFNNSRKLATFEYIDTWNKPNKPAHYGSNPSVITLEIK